MNLKHLSDSALLENTDSLVRRERELLSEILHHLREIERRRLFSLLGYKSLFDYATRKLGYADDQAARRISAMRLIKELPELEDKIVTGSLTLTNLSLAQSFFRQEQKVSAAYTKEEKLDLVFSLEKKSKREAEKIFVSQSSEPERARPDRVRVLSENTVEIKFTAGCELQRKIERVKGLLAHSQSNRTLAEVLEVLCDMAIEKLDPAEKVKSSAAPERAPAKSPAPALKRRISVRVRRQVWRDANSRCQNCSSEYALQVDHIKPKALGGSDQPENLRLLCRPCNQRAAIDHFGVSKMLRHLERPAGG